MKQSCLQDSDSDDAASSTSSLASGGVESGQGSASTAPKAAERDVIADGALSDSEVDRNRNAPQPVTSLIYHHSTDLSWFYEQECTVMRTGC